MIKKTLLLVCMAFTLQANASIFYAPQIESWNFSNEFVTNLNLTEYTYSSTEYVDSWIITVDYTFEDTLSQTYSWGTNSIILHDFGNVMALQGENVCYDAGLNEVCNEYNFNNSFSDQYDYYWVDDTVYNSIFVIPLSSSYSAYHELEFTRILQPSEVPVPAAAWLFMSALVGLVGTKRLSRQQVD